MKTIKRLFSSVAHLLWRERKTKYRYINLQRAGYINKWAVRILVKHKAIDKESGE